MSFYRAYDIRGLYKKEITEAIAEDIAHAFVHFTKCKRVLIGHDARTCAPSITAALQKGLVDANCDVTSLGCCTTPMTYCYHGLHNFDASIMVTASHNPAEYIGFKLSGKSVIPIGAGSGMEEIERLARSKVRVASKPGSSKMVDGMKEYREFLRQHVQNPPDGLHVIVDCGNSVGAFDLEHMKAICGPRMRWQGLFTELDGTFPNHQPNPLDPACMQDLIAQVRKAHAHVGVAFDGDGDRVGFVDEKGVIVEADMVLALLCVDHLETHDGGHFLYDLRSSNAVREAIAKSGGTSSMARVGHGFIKRQMRAESAILGGELACHFYFQDAFNTDNGVLCALRLLSLLARKKKPLSELVKPFRIYARSGEINLHVKDAQSALSKAEKALKGKGQLTTIDGIRVDGDDFWVNVRKSNTEPLVRIVVEAKTAERMAKVRDEMVALLRSA